MQPPGPWAPQATAAFPERALGRPLREGFHCLTETGPALSWTFMESSPVKSPGVSSILVGVSGSGLRGVCCSALRQSLPLTCSIFSWDSSGQPSSTTAPFCALGSLGRQTVSPDDLDTEQGSRSAEPWAVRLQGWVEVLPVTGRNVTAVLEPQFQGTGVLELSWG